MARVACLVALLVVFAGLQDLAAQTPVSFEGRLIRTISREFDGPIKGVRPQDLDALFVLQPGQPFRLADARATVRRLYATELFFDIQVAVEPVGPGAIDVVVRLSRRYRVGEIRFEGSLSIDRAALRQQIQLRSEEPFSEALLAESVQRLEQLYRRHGYYQSGIQPRTETDPDDALVKLTFQIDSGERASVGNFSMNAGPLDIAELSQHTKLRSGASYSTLLKDEDLDRLRYELARRGYLRAGVYAEEGQYDPAANGLSLHYEITPGQWTDVVFEGFPLEEKVYGDLPIFSGRGPEPILIRETIDALTRHLQSESYLRAAVSVQRENPDNGRPRILFVMEPGPELEIKRVDFQGNLAFRTSALRNRVRARPAGWLDKGEFSDEIVRADTERLTALYHRAGYLEAGVEPRVSVDGKALMLVYVISEGIRSEIASLEFSGNQSFSSEELATQLTSPVEAPYSPARVAIDRAAILTFYENRGFRNVDLVVETEQVEPNRFSLAYRITENARSFVDQTIILGNRRTSRRLIERQILLKAGEPFSLERALLSETNLHSLSVFRRVQIRSVDSVRRPDQKLVFVGLEEAAPYTLLYGVGFSSFDGPRGTVGLSHNNVLGTARTLSLSLRAGARRQRGNISLRLPRLLSRRLPSILSLSVDNEDRVSETGERRLSDLRGRPFDSLRFSLSAQAERILSRRESLFFRYNFERVELEVPEDLITPLQFFRQEERLRLSTLSLTYLNESRDSATSPTSGFFVNGETQLSAKAIGSDEQFFRFLAQGSIFHSVSPSLVLAASTRLGIIAPFRTGEKRQVENSVPISERFFAGGATTLRGLPQDLAGPLLRDPETGEPIAVNKGTNENPDFTSVPLGGNALFITNLEMRFPLWKQLGGAFFFDTGNVFRSVTKISSAGFSNAAGFGLSFNTPVGPIRFDIAYNPNPPNAAGFSHWNFHVNLGHPF